MRIDEQALSDRVGRLEKENRYLKLFAVVVASGALAFLFVAAGKTPRTIEAEKFVLLDGHGNPRVTISTPEFSGATIEVNADDPVIWLTDKNGADRAMLTVDGLFFANGKGRPTVSLTSNPKSGKSELKFYKPDGKVAWLAP